jgi:uncharacterized glyoxalase superfamily protein PhnB
MQKVAPTLIVDTVEPTMEFMIDRLGFQKVVDVPGESGLAFAMLVNGNVEIHLQSKESAVKDISYFSEAKTPSPSFLYIDVDDVKALYEKLKDVVILKPIEKTFYGATHFFVREPGGHVLGFSQNE